MAYIAYVDGTFEEIDPKTVTLTRAQEIVGGYVERVFPRATPEVLMLVDEEGLLKAKPINLHGCMLYGTDLHGHPIAGNVIVIMRSEGRKWI